MSKTLRCSGNTNPRSRAWCLTLWSEPAYDQIQMKYLCYGVESCPTTGKTHWQSYVYFYNAKTFSQCKKYFGEDAHIEASRGNPEQNKAYCSKDTSDFKEYGDFPRCGQRTDLDAVKTEIMSGEKSLTEIILETPMTYHQYGRTLEKLDDIRMQKLIRTEMTKGVWIWGPTGVGKSHKANELAGPGSYWVPKDNGWWDTYTQNRAVIINDFRGHIPYDEILTMVDKWPYTVKRRGRAPLPFTSELVIITSSLPPEEVYHNRNENDSIEQLLRRFEVIELKKKSEFETVNLIFES